jgi:hypothetical protein
VARSHKKACHIQDAPIGLLFNRHLETNIGGMQGKDPFYGSGCPERAPAPKKTRHARGFFVGLQPGIFVLELIIINDLLSHYFFNFDSNNSPLFNA